MKVFRIFIIINLFLFLFLAKNAVAEMKEGAISLSPQIGGFSFDDDQNIDDDLVYGIGLGYNFTENWGVESFIHYIDTETEDTNKDIDTYIYRLDGLYHFIPEKKLVPYLAAGIGAIRIEGNVDQDGSFPFLNYGAGIKYFLTKALAVRGDVRHIITDDSNHDFIYTLGLTFLFGGKEKELPPMDSDGDGVYDDRDKCPGTPAGVPVDDVGCPKDSDGDGVYDHKDKCPGTPAGVSVDTSGCPLDSDGDGVYDYEDKCPNTPKGTPVDRNGCPKDSDGDGVYDSEDKCPGTPRGAPVDRNGCPTDSDGDGVYDYLDKCPDTPRGIEVDSNGCPVPIKEKVSIELKVEFDFDKATIKSVYDDHLQKVANFLKAYPDTEAVIEGHTDSIGAEEYNRILSQKRADTVRKYLLDNFDIEHWRISAKGYGESRPISDNKTKEGRQRNRRVTAVISTVVTK
jgi:OOP family OmpA-OmpF porin